MSKPQNSFWTEPSPTPKKANYGLKKSETTPKLGQSQKSELKELKES